MQAITPAEAIQAKAQLSDIPTFVFDIFNKLIILELSNNIATISQESVVSAILAQYSNSRQEIFDKHWLDVEPVYKAAGWKVEYDKPGYNETYSATFTFSIAAK